MKKFLRILAIALTALVTVGCLWIALGMLGNPVSKALSTHAAKDYLTETHPNGDYTLERVTYNFKDGCYHAFYTDGSLDGDFTAVFTMGGKYRYDTYDSVIDGFNTARRLDIDYRQLADTLLESPDFPYPCHIAFGTLECYPQEAFDDPNVTDVPSYAINQSALIVNGSYDIAALGAEAGHLVLYIDTYSPNAETAAAILTDLRHRADAAGVPFRAVTLVLQHPETAEDLRMEHFLYEDIEGEGLTDRVTAAVAATEAWYAAQEKEKAIE